MNNSHKVIYTALIIVAAILIVMGLFGDAETIAVGISLIAVWISLREGDDDENKDG